MNSIEFIPSQHAQRHGLILVGISKSVGQQLLVTVSPWYKWRQKHSFKKIIVLADGVFDLGAMLYDPKTRSIWQWQIKLPQVFIDNKSRLDHMRAVEQLERQRVSNKTYTAITVCIATANTPSYSPAQSLRLGEMINTLANCLPKSQHLRVVVSPGKNAREHFEGVEDRFGWQSVQFDNFIDEIDLLICTKSTLITTALSSGICVVELKNKIIGSSLADLSICDAIGAKVISQAVAHAVHSLEAGSQKDTNFVEKFLEYVADND